MTPTDKTPRVSDERLAATLTFDMKPSENMLNQLESDLAHDLKDARARVAELERNANDDPELDATDAAHPAWWRGQEQGAAAVCLRIAEWVKGEARGGSHYEPLESARASVLALVDRVAELEREVERINAARTAESMNYATLCAEIVEACNVATPTAFSWTAKDACTEVVNRAESAERSAREAIAEARRDVDSANLALAAMEAERNEARAEIAHALRDDWIAEPWTRIRLDHERMQAFLSRPVSSTEALRAVVTKAVADAGRHAAKIAALYAEKGGTFDGDTAEAAILNDLCDPDDPDTVRIVSRAIGGEQ